MEVLYDMLTKHRADVSVVGMKEVDNFEMDISNITEYTETIIDNSQESIRRMLLRQPFGVSPCAKLYKQELFQKIKFPVGRLYEDLLTISYIFEDCQKVVYTETQMYFYYQRHGSTTNRPFSERDLQAFDGLRQIVDYIDTRFPKIHDAAVCRYLDDSLIIFFSVLSGRRII